MPFIIKDNNHSKDYDVVTDWVIVDVDIFMKADLAFCSKIIIEVLVMLCHYMRTLRSDISVSLKCAFL